MRSARCLVHKEEVAEMTPPFPSPSGNAQPRSSGVAGSAVPSDTPPVVWTIAGHDPSSGAGITADQLTFASHGLFAATVITALTAQSTLGVASVYPVPADFLRLSLEHLYADLPPAGVKIGMLGSVEAVRVLAGFLADLRERSPGGAPVPVVLDPVLVSSSGRALFPAESLKDLHRTLLPLVDVMTPNRAELAALTGRVITTDAELLSAAEALSVRHPHLALVLTGGDGEDVTDTVRLPDGTIHRFSGVRLESRATHGTGCAFSSALLAGLVRRQSLPAAVAAAKRFVAEGIRRAPEIGHGNGPLDLLWPLK